MINSEDVKMILGSSYIKHADSPNLNRLQNLVALTLSTNSAIQISEILGENGFKAKFGFEGEYRTLTVKSYKTNEMIFYIKSKSTKIYKLIDWSQLYKYKKGTVLTPTKKHYIVLQNIKSQPCGRIMDFTIVENILS